MDGLSLRKSVDRMCKQCLYDPREPGTWRQQVEACTMPECHLYPVRPIPDGRTPKRQKLRPLIDRECKNCIYDPDDNGTWRQQVERCGSGHCALHDVRPGPIEKKPPKQPERILRPKNGGGTAILTPNSVRYRKFENLLRRHRFLAIKGPKPPSSATISHKFGLPAPDSGQEGKQ